MCKRKKIVCPLKESTWLFILADKKWNIEELNHRNDTSKSLECIHFVHAFERFMNSGSSYTYSLYIHSICLPFLNIWCTGNMGNRIFYYLNCLTGLTGRALSINRHANTLQLQCHLKLLIDLKGTATAPVILRHKVNCWCNFSSTSFLNQKAILTLSYCGNTSLDELFYIEHFIRHSKFIDHKSRT